MLIRTAQMRYSGPDKLDITVKSGDKAFAPTWDMVMGFKRGTLPEWEYTERYVELMRRSFQAKKARWKEVWAMEQVTLACYCPSGTFCHRHLLAEILANPTKYLLNPDTPSFEEDSAYFKSLQVELGGEVEIPKRVPETPLAIQPALF